MPVQGFVNWPGVPTDQVIGLRMTLSGSTAPSVAQLACGTNLGDVAQFGTLSFGSTGGPGQGPIALTECARATAREVLDGNGAHWVLPIYDRRWRWQYGHISGSYNQVRPDGSLVRETEPQQLAALCFAAFGETRYDVSRMPNAVRPAVLWDRANAADALQALCSELGCIIHLNPLTNTAEVWPIGSGNATLPDYPGESIGYSLGGQIQPEQVELIAGPTEFESEFYAYEPVGLDTDGRWKPIDDLSYKPAGGWEREPVDFPNISGSYNDPNTFEPKDIRSLAVSTVWRRYKILGQFSGLFPGLWSPTYLFDSELEPQEIGDLQFLNGRVGASIDTDGTPRRLPIEVRTRHWRHRGGDSETYLQYDGTVNLDTKLGQVVFNEPVFRATADGLGGWIYTPASVLVRCAYHAGRGGVYHCYTRLRETGSTIKTEPESLRFSRVSLKVVEDGVGDVISTTESEIQSEADLQLDGYVAKYADQPAGGFNYSGIIPLALNGVVRQVTWSLGHSSPSSTVVSLSRETQPFVPSFEERERERLIRENEARIEIERGRRIQHFDQIGFA